MPVTIRNPYLRWCWTALGTGLVLAGIATVAVLFVARSELKGKEREAWVAIPFVLVPIALGILFGAFLLLLSSRRVQRIIDRVRNEPLLARWEYSTAEWEAFQAAEAPLSRRDFRQHILLPVVTGIPVALVILSLTLFADEKKPRPDALLTVFIGVAVFLGLLLAVAYYVRVVRQRAGMERQRLSPPASYLHADFVYANGEFVYGLMNQKLAAVQLVSEAPSRIEFTTTGSAPRGGEITEVRRVLIPRGQEQRAGEIVETIRSAWRLP